MPITQQRMIALINAARDFEQAFDRACQLIDKERLERPGEEGLQSLHFYINSSGLLSHPIDTRLTIEREHHHFRKTYRYNDRQALKAAKKRGQGGLRITAPIPQPSRPYEELPITRTTAPQLAPASQRARAFGSAWDEAEAVSEGLPIDHAEIDREVEQALRRVGPDPEEIKAAARRINAQSQADLDARAKAKLAELNKPKETFGIEDLLGGEGE